MNQELVIHNSLTRKKEKFQALNAPFVGMYVCGPTVYSYVHLGNLRTFIAFDIVYRYLTFLGYKVRYVRNITDVGHLVDDVDYGEDKIAKRARLENKDPMEIVQYYTNDFHLVMSTFNTFSPSIEPSATGHIVEQIEMVKKIIAAGLAYEVNGSVYFDVLAYQAKYKNYGELSGRVLEELFENTRDNLEGTDEKKNPYDFAIWKKADKGHIMRWPSPWGEGFPGWHLECSVMSTRYLGETFDIHGGGMDLKFPHHECEIAQHTACVGTAPVKYWMHANMLTVNGQKMSKSLGNSFLPLELVSGDHPLLEKGYSPMTIRFFFLQAHYASTLDFTNEAMQAAEKGFKRMLAAVETLEKIKPSTSSSCDVIAFEKKCYQAMNDDFNCPILIANLFDGVVLVNRLAEESETITASDLEKLKKTFHVFLFDVLGLQNEKQSDSSGTVEKIMQVVLNLRKQARDKKDFATSDIIRDQLKEAGIEIKDGKDGVTWEKS
ncbi:MAG: cysteine--tRNA ligase [Flavobacteriales bacterium]